MARLSKEEYQRLRKTALKRIARLEKAGLSKGLRKNYKQGKSFPTYSELKKDARKFAKAAIQVQSFLAAKTSTVRGARAAELRTLQTIGAIENTKEWRKAPKNVQALFRKDVENFGKFMQATKEAAGDAAFDSERAVNAFKQAKENGLDAMKIARSFQKWQENNVDKKIARRKTRVTDEQLNKYLEGGATNGTTESRRNSRGDNRQTRGVSASRSKSKAQKKKRR